jgi:hypothetical protein
MALIIRTNYSEQQVLAPWAIIKGESKRVTLDLRSAEGALLKIAVGTGGTTALTNGVAVYVARTLANDAAGNPCYSAYCAQFQSRTTAGARQINNGAGYAAGAAALAFDQTGGTAFAVGDKLFFWGVTTVPTASGAIGPANGCEVLTVSKGTSTPVTVIQPCRYAKIDNEWFSQADSWEVWVRGGATVAITFDYGDDAAGEAVACMCDAVVETDVRKVTS